MTDNYVPGKQAFLVNTYTALSNVKELCSGGNQACFVVEVSDDVVVATAPIGWKLRGLRWSTLIKEWIDTGIKISEFPQHKSDCASRMSAYPNRPCDCGIIKKPITEKELWWMMDKFCVQESAKGEGNYKIGLVENIEKAMKWLEQPTPEECRLWFSQMKDIRR